MRIAVEGQRSREMTDDEIDEDLRDRYHLIGHRACPTCGVTPPTPKPTLSVMSSSQLRACIESNADTDRVGASWVRICTAELAIRGSAD